jgi:SAM-dependent methyltransferase
MTGRETLFGRAVADLYRGEMKEPFTVCDATGEYPLDLRFYLTDAPDPYEAEALRFARGRILDIGCGAGRILQYLQKQGMEASGFDLDPLLVSVCRERGIRDVFVESYDSLARFAPVDTILWMNRTLCTAGSLTKIKTLLSQCFSTCGDAGVLIFDSLDVRADRANAGPGVLQNKVWFRYGEQTDEPFERVYFSSDVADSLLEDTGWFCERTIRDSDRYTKICKKHAFPVNKTACSAS